jgi:hypothetical protein
VAVPSPHAQLWMPVGRCLTPVTEGSRQPGAMLWPRSRKNISARARPNVALFAWSIAPPPLLKTQDESQWAPSAIAASWTARYRSRLMT